MGLRLQSSLRAGGERDGRWGRAARVLRRRTRLRSEHFSDQYDEVVSTEDGTIVLETRSTNHVETSTGSTSFHEHHAKTLGTSTGTTIHDIVSDTGTIKQASHQSIDFTIYQDGILSGWSEASRRRVPRSTRSPASTLATSGTRSSASSACRGHGCLFSNTSSMTRSNDDRSSASLRLRRWGDDGVHGLEPRPDTHPVLKRDHPGRAPRSVGSSSGMIRVCGNGHLRGDQIRLGQFDQPGPVELADHGASGTQVVVEHWTNVGEETWSSTRHDVDDLSDQDGSIGPVTFDSGNSGTRWTNGTDQNGTTLSRVETWTLSESDGQTTYSETTTDNTTDVFGSGGGAPTSSGTRPRLSQATRSPPSSRREPSRPSKAKRRSRSLPPRPSPSELNALPGDIAQCDIGIKRRRHVTSLSGGTMSTSAVGSTSTLYNGYRSLLQQDYLGNGQYAIYYIDKGWFYNDPPVYVGNLDQNTGLVTRNGKTIPPRPSRRISLATAGTSRRSRGSSTTTPAVTSTPNSVVGSSRRISGISSSGFGTSLPQTYRRRERGCAWTSSGPH